MLKRRESSSLSICTKLTGLGRFFCACNPCNHPFGTTFQVSKNVPYIFVFLPSMAKTCFAGQLKLCKIAPAILCACNPCRHPFGTSLRLSTKRQDSRFAQLGCRRRVSRMMRVQNVPYIFVFCYPWQKPASQASSSCAKLLLQCCVPVIYAGIPSRRAYNFKT